MIPEMQQAINRLERKTTDHEEGLKILRDELRKLRAELGLAHDKLAEAPNYPREPTPMVDTPTGVSKWSV